MAHKPLDTAAVLRENAEKLRDLMRSIELHGDGEHESTIGNLARVSQALVAACGELRQHAKGERRALATYTDEQIVAHIRSLSERRRDDIIRQVTGADDQEPLL